MPRPRHFKNINFESEFSRFKPHGVPMAGLEKVILSNEELEALRLKNLLGLDQVEAAGKMKTSQSTFQRLLSSAYKKISDALINGKIIEINRLEYPSRQFECWQCRHHWQEPFGNGRRGVDMSCPECGSREIHRCDQHGHGFGKQIWGYKHHHNNREEQ